MRMNHDVELFRREVRATIERSRAQGRQGRQTLSRGAVELLRWREERSIPGLWTVPPLMVTATLDDAFGFGLEVIHDHARAAGLRVHPLGLRQAPARIVASCRELRPDLLGLTVIQLDSEEALAEVAGALPPETRVVVGGPIFAADRDLAPRCGVHFVAHDAIAFLELLLDLDRE